jgi:hypothetical protein
MIEQQNKNDCLDGMKNTTQINLIQEKLPDIIKVKFRLFGSDRMPGIRDENESVIFK